MASPANVSIADRLDFLGLDTTGRAALSRARPLIEEALPGALDSLYDQVRRTPRLRGTSVDESQLQRARSADAARWSRLASGAVDQAQGASGAEANWRLAGDGRVLEALVRHLILKGAKSRGLFGGGVDGPALAEAVGALVKVAITDIESAAEARLEQAVRDAGAAAGERQSQDTDREAVVSALGSAMARMADGDLDATIPRPFAAEYEPLRDHFNTLIGHYAATLGQVTGGAGGIGANADQVVQATDTLSRRTEQQAASLAETAAALDQITATVKRTAAGARQANQAVAAARDEAERSGVVVSDAVGAMGQIEKSSTEISQIIGVIDEIAFQTNLLALNAGVEAARAGEAGRGFAVVASEVRALAQRSAEAAKEIKALISASSSHVGHGVDLVGATGKALQSISSKVAEIDSLVAGIAASAEEQSTGLQQVNTAVNQMDQMVQQNAAMVEQSTAASHALKAESAELERLLSMFRTAGGFVRPAPRPATSRSTPMPSPARAMADKVAKSFGQAPSRNDGWQEF